MLRHLQTRTHESRFARFGAEQLQLDVQTVVSRAQIFVNLELMTKLTLNDQLKLQDV